MGGGRWSRFRAESFGAASEQPYRRRVSDWIRLALGVAVLALLAAHEGDPTQFERDLFELVNGLPDSLRSLFLLVAAVGALWAVGLVVGAAVVARRWRLARDMAVGGVVTWGLGRFANAFVSSGEGFSESLRVVIRAGKEAPSFPAVRVAVITAVIAVAAPYLSRPVRRLGGLLVVASAFSPLYLGNAFPEGAFGGLVLGWTVAAATHLVFGSPGGRPTSRQVQAALAELGVDVDSVTLAAHQPAAGTLMHATRGDDVMDLRVLGRDERDAQFLSKFWRSLAYRDGGSDLHLTRLEEVESEAFAMLLAERAGLRVPSVVVVGTAGPRAALVAVEGARGVALADLPADSVTDDQLRELWRAIGRLHGARVVHGRLNLRHVVLDGSALGLVDFHHASGTAATSTRRARDVAEMLASTAGAVGPERAVRAAIDGLGRDAVVTALPVLQPAALSREIRPFGRKERKAFADLLARVREAAATAAGVEPPPLQPLYRVDATNLLMAVGTLIAIGALLSQVGSPQVLWDTITEADLGWLTAAMVVSLATNVATAVALMGTVPIPLPLWRTSELQLSMSFSNLAVPAVGGMAAQVRFLQRQGVDLASAVASGGLLINLGNIVAQVVLLGVAIGLSPADFSRDSVPTDKVASLVLLVIVVAVVVIGLVLGIPKLRRLVVPPTRSAISTVWGAVRSPRRVVQLLGGNAVNAVMYAFVQLACVNAFGGSIDFWTLLALNILVSTIASLVPVPGGGTAVSSVGMSGALTAFGVPTEIAVAAVLANQLVTSFIPAVPGWFVTNDLLRHDYL